MGIITSAPSLWTKEWVLIQIETETVINFGLSLLQSHQ
jgi:hypothetical protein